MARLEIRDLSFAYPAHREINTLENVSLSIAQGEYVVLCGRSGSGKTTLLRHLKTTLTPHGVHSGEILYGGKPLCEISLREQTAKIGYVMQNPDDQAVTDKVWHELAFGLESLGCDQKTMRARVAEMACYFGIQGWFHKDVATLSGGQKQLLNLASVMALQPEILILDEPTSQLDPIAASDFLGTVKKINRDLGTTVIISEHRLEEIFPAADRAVVMEGGRIIADDTPRRIGSLLQRNGHPMFAAMPAPVRVFYAAGGEGESPLTVREGRTWLTDTVAAFPNVKSLPAEEKEKKAEPFALQLQDVWFRYEKNGKDILRGVELQLSAGELHAVVGGNGAGKSTMLRSICGICKAQRGKVRVFGKAVEKYGKALFDGCVSMLPQDPKSLFVKDTLREDLREMTDDEAEILQTAKLCCVEELLDAHPYDLSGGEQQRAALAKVLLTKPKLLLLDEPTKGIDSFFKETLAEIFSRLCADGVTILMVSHDVEFCAKHAGSVSMFFDGQILTTDTPRRFFGSNSFYTTAANRMSRHVFDYAVTAEDVAALCRANREERA